MLSGMMARGVVLDVARQRGGAEPSTVTLSDHSRFGNNGAMTNVTWVQLPSGLWVMDFDGTSRVDCGNDKSLNITTAITIEAWVKGKTAQDGTQRVIVDKSELWGFLYDHAVPGMRGFYFIDSAGGWHLSGIVISEDVWHHVVGVYDNPYIQDYLDGERKVNNNIGGFTIKTGVNHFGIGADVTFGIYRFDGLISGVRIYSYALTPAAIRSRFTATRRLFGV